jgi:hypothetical protein
MARPLKEIRESMIRKSRKGSAIASNQRHYRKGERDAANRIADFIDDWTKFYSEEFFPKSSSSREAIGALYLRIILPNVARAIREGKWRE